MNSKALVRTALVLLVAMAPSSASARGDCVSVYDARSAQLRRLFLYPSGMSAAVGAGSGAFLTAPAGQNAAVRSGAWVGAAAGAFAFVAGALGRARRIEGLARVIELAESGGALHGERDGAGAERVLATLVRRVNRRSAVGGTRDDVLRVLRETNNSGELCREGEIMGLGKMSRFVARRLDPRREGRVGESGAPR